MLYFRLRLPSFHRLMLLAHSFDGLIFNGIGAEAVCSKTTRLEVLK